MFVMLHKNQIISLIFQVSEFSLTKLGDKINLKKKQPPNPLPPKYDLNGGPRLGQIK